MSEFLYKELSYQIIGICFKVHKALGPALPELVYNRALYLEFDRQGLKIETERQFKVFYDGVDVHRLLRIRALAVLGLPWPSQHFTYLNVTGIKVGYLVNFGPRKMEFKRLIL